MASDTDIITCPKCGYPTVAMRNSMWECHYNLCDFSSKVRPGSSPPIWDLVIEEMKGRDEIGRAKYGVPLQADNGRDGLRDAFEEALDLVVYLRKLIYERDGK